ERAVRPVPEEGVGLALDRLRGADLHTDAGGGAGDLRPAQAAWAQDDGPVEGARAGPGERQACAGQGWAVRAVRHRRRLQRDPETVTLDRAAELLAEKRAKGPPKKKSTAKKSTAKKKS